jgi:hypothetical protein
MPASRSIAFSAKAICLGLLIAACPVKIDLSEHGFAFGASVALAKKGGDDDGGGSGGGGGSDDNSGSGGGGGSDDNSGPGGGDDDNSGSGGGGGDDDSGSGSGDDDDDGTAQGGKSKSGGGKGALGAKDNITLKYSNGWNESIVNGRYRLVDPKGRTVADRRATLEDLRRMREAAGK